jgi:hypothetical protein
MKAKRTRKVAVELWQAKFSLAKIMEQLQMSKATLKHVLSHARAHPEQPVQKGKKGSCRVSKEMNITLQAMKRHLNREDNPPSTSKISCPNNGPFSGPKSYQ